MAFRFVDLFCGAGGATCGLLQALQARGIDYQGFVVNHWDIAIATHERNHPEVATRCAAVEDITPDEVFDSNPKTIDLLWASPTCTHFSSALGGAPRSNQLRSQPEYILPWLRMTHVRRVFIENVPEFQQWGPLLESPLDYHGRHYKPGQPDPRQKGLFFRDWIRSAEVSGYKVEWRVLNAANFGAPTSRRRLIVQMARGTEPIVWPRETHPESQWIPASSVIDTSLPSESIFDRKRPLAASTMRKIRNGIQKYWGTWAPAFLAALDGETREVPVPTDTPTPFLTRFNGGENRNHALTQPVPVIDTSNRYGLVAPCIVKYYGTGTNAVDLTKPLDTVTTHDRFGLVEGRILHIPTRGTYRLDILFRMLAPSELAAAMSFPKDYTFCGTQTEVKRQIGNAVCPRLAQALVAAIL